jgi:hypothetical protein
MGNRHSIISYDIPRTPSSLVPSEQQHLRHQNWLELICYACETKFTVSITTHNTYCVYTLHLESEILDICTIKIYAFNINDYESYVVRLNDCHSDPSTLNSITPPIEPVPAHINTYEFKDIMQWYKEYSYKKLETMSEVGQEILNICGKGTFGATFLLQP